MGIISGEKIVELAQASDLGADAAKNALVKAVGDISEVEILGENLLVATYIRPEKTDGGIIRAKDSIKEDEYQGNAGLVLKLWVAILEEVEPSGLLHKWVLFGYNDGLKLHHNKVHCRIIHIDRIRAIIPDPKRVF